MIIGKRIAKIRRSKRISQTDLSEGIISQSHLCNIEVGRYVPQENVLWSISERLEVPYQYLSSYQEKCSNLEEDLRQFKVHLETNIKKATTYLQLIESKYPFINHLEQEIKFYIYKCCYLIKIDKIQKAKKHFDEEFLQLVDEERIHELPSDIQEAYYYFKGVYGYYTGDYMESYHFYHELLTKQDSHSKANTLFNITLLLLKNYEYKKAVLFAKKALVSFKNQRRWRDVAALYNIIGVIHWETNDLNFAKNFLMKALKIANRHNYNFLKSKVYHNLGLIYKSKLNYRLAYHSFNKSLELKKEHNYENIHITYRSILQLLLENGKKDDVPRILQHAYEYSFTRDETCHLQVIEAKLNHINNNVDKYERNMIDAITYFEKNHVWKHVYTYAEELANYFHEDRQYKQASVYFRKALDAYKKC